MSEIRFKILKSVKFIYGQDYLETSLRLKSVLEAVP